MSSLGRLVGAMSLLPALVLTQDCIAGLDVVHGHLLDNSTVITKTGKASKSAIDRPAEAKYDRWYGSARLVPPLGNTWCLPLGNSDRTLILVNKFIYTFPDERQVQVGDIVVMYDPYDPSRKIMRRVRATNKEWVRYEVGGVEYVTIVPTGKCFVECDSSLNDESQLDSRHFGTIPNSLIIGTACGAIFPLGRFKQLHFSYKEISIEK